MPASILVFESASRTPRRQIGRLVAKGNSIVSLTNAETAKELISRCLDLFSLVLLDASAGGTASLCAELRRVGFWKSIVIFDGAIGEDAVVDALEAGADDFLPAGCSMREAEGRLNARLRDADRHKITPRQIWMRRLNQRL